MGAAAILSCIAVCFAVCTGTASGQRICSCTKSKNTGGGGGDHSTGAKVLPDSVCFVARPGIALVGVASEETVVFLDRHLCEISFIVECCDSSFDVASTIMPADEVRIGRGARGTEPSEYGNALLLLQLALDLTG